MKFYVKTNIFSIRGTMTFSDESGQPLYYSKRKIFALTRIATISTADNTNILRIDQNLITWFSRKFKIRDMRTKQIVGRCATKVFTLKTGSMKVDLGGQEFTVTGSFFAFQFKIVDSNGETVVTANKKLLSWGDAYEIDVHKPEVVAPELIVALCTIFNHVRRGRRG